MALTPKTSDKITHAMSAACDFPDHEPSTRYLILSTPRTGSSLLARTLYNTGHAGFPAEYLNPRYLLAYKTRTSAADSIRLQSYLQFLEQKRTSPNGVFGMNCHYHQIAELIKKKAGQISFLKRFDKIITTDRRNRLYQTISFLKAKESDVWTITDDEVPEYKPDKMKFKPGRISAHIGMFIQHNARINQLLAEIEVPSLHIDYKEIDEDYPTVWRNVCKFLDLPEIELASVCPSLKRLRDATTDQLAEDYIRFIRGD